MIYIEKQTQRALQEMEELLCQFLWSHLQSLGLFREKHVVLAHLREQAGISTSYDRWLEESVALLERQHYLHCSGVLTSDGPVTCTVEDPILVESATLWQQWDQHKERWMQNVDLKAQVVLVETTLRALPAILTGKQPALEVLFPNGSMQLVEGIYQHNVIADSFNDVLSHVVATYVQERLTREKHARIRILEVGAGTGGTTGGVLRSLQRYQASIAEYCYSDVSEAFLQYGQRMYAEYPFMTYRLVNVEKPLAAQGIEKAGYDLVIAANVVHATSNIRRTMQNMKAALKKHGWLLLNEITGTSLFSHLTFGLLAGWWAYEDAELRVPGGPALSAESWKAVLSSEGFEAIPIPVAGMQEASQQIIVAESDGMGRQGQTQGASGTANRSAVKHPERGEIRNRSQESAVRPRSEGVDVVGNGPTDRMVFDHVQSIILESCAEVLKMQEGDIKEEKSFAEYGVDSIVGINFINVINQKSHLSLPTTVLFDYNTVELLRHYILREHGVTVRAQLKERTQSGEAHSLPQALPKTQMAQSVEGQKSWGRFQEGRQGFVSASYVSESEPRLNGQRREERVAPVEVPNMMPEHEPRLNGQRREERVAPVEVPNTMPEHEPIAIIGMSGRFAGSKNVSELWEHLAQGTDLVGEVSRWDVADLVLTAGEASQPYCKHGSFLEGIDQFDPLFFSISGLEATYMDPQQRLVLEEAWKALEDAGYAGSSIDGRQCGVYIGCAAGDYQSLFDETSPAQAFWGNAGSVIPARIAYSFNLQGPAIAIDTACSSSLVAMHLACQGLWGGEIEMALAGGVSVECTPQFYQWANRAEMLSVNGRCSTFDDRADGFVPGEGVGVVVLKRLKDALASGDHIYGVIRGSGMNQDGATRGITAPSVNSQERLIRSVYETFQIDPAQIQMMEAHGTGTKLGDPIEFEALTRVFRKDMPKEAYCALGSIKSNLGHTVTAAGVAGVIKVLLSLQHKQIPPSLHFESGNSHIEWKGSPFYVNTQLQDWSAARGTDEGRYAAVSSFGISGTNAHLVIEQAPEHRRRPTARPGYLIVLSARTSEQLRQQVEQLATFCEQGAEIDCGNMSYTLLLGRKHLKLRLACVVQSAEELVAHFRRWLEKGKVPQISVSDLSNREQRESPSLRRYGNHCIEECQRTAGSESYLENLEAIADLYLQGYGLTYERLFAEGEYGRISLPTYPFAGESYWVRPPQVKPRESLTAVSSISALVPLPASLQAARTMLLTPSWQEEALRRASLSEEVLLPGEKHPAVAATLLVLLCDLPGIEASRIQAQLTSGGRCRRLPAGMRMGASPIPTAPLQQSRRGQSFQDRVVHLIQELQDVQRSRPAGQVLVQVVVAHCEEASLLEALVGVLKVAQQEYPKLQGQLIEVDGEPEEEELLLLLRENQRYSPREPHIRYARGKRWVRGWQEHPEETTPTSIPWKEGGCYLITGGAGGLARLYIQEIARQVKNASVILMGRSVLSQEVRASLKSGGAGLHIDYQQVDVSDGPAVHALIERVLAHYGHLDGIIHAAGVLHHTRFIDKTPEDVRAVLAPKVMGVEHLDEASSQIPLDFFLLCSSLSAVLGGVELVDYAAANAYLDAFAHERQTKVVAGERQGQTLSVNWPYWEAGGMQIDAEALQMMRELLGEEPLETETGMRLLSHALASGHAQVIVLHGQVERIKQVLLHQSPEVSVRVAPVERVAAPDREGEQEPGTVPTDTLRKALSQVVCDLLKVQVGQIDARTQFAEYGFDSLTFVQLAKRLNQTYQLNLTPPLFYEYSTIESLTQYLQTTFAAVLASHFAAPAVAVQPVESEAVTRSERPLTVPIAQRRPRLDHSHMLVSEREAPAGAEPIAIIGMSGSFPEAPDVQNLWSHLLEGRDCIGEIPASRWEWPQEVGHPATVKTQKTNIKWAGVMEGMETFDPHFFGISPREAELMDPQQRLLMMYVWKAIEDAGYSASSLSGSNTALFVGTGSTGYSEQMLRANRPIEGASVTGLAPTMGPNRMSYFLNLHGPSEPIDTACSSSLVAVHRGVKVIESGECDMVIVGGVNTLVSPEAHISASKAGMLSEDGRCKTFSAAANGYVRGEGVGMLVLKRLSAAERDGDHIYGVIRGSAENHGGRANSLTAPNPRAQADLLIAAYRKAGIDPRTVSYIEAHGTGTSLGDPIEINGLKMAWSELCGQMGAGPIAQAVCGIGTVKSNIGHLELAAGVAGVIKVLMQLGHKKLVKSLHSEPINPYIELEGSPFYIVRENRDWEALHDDMGNALPRRAGVSSFGFGGVNAHVVLEEYVPKLRAMPSRSHSRAPALIVLSAKNEEQLYEQVQQLQDWVQEYSVWAGPTGAGETLDNLAYTLQVGREAMEERLALQVKSLVELSEKLGRYLQEGHDRGDWHRGQVKRHNAIEAFVADEDGQKAVAAWMSKGKYEKLLELWVKGLTIDWKLLYGEHLPQRMSLPTYPFARERYWIPMGGDRSAQSEVPTTPTLTFSSTNVEADIPVAQGTRATAAKIRRNGEGPNPVWWNEWVSTLAPDVKTHGNGGRPDPVGQTHKPQSVALRPLTASPVPSSGRSSDLSWSTHPLETNELPPASDLSLSGLSFSQPINNNEVSHETNRLATHSDSRVLAAGLPHLEEELTKSLAQTLYMDQSNIDVETPFAEMGLDSVLSVEWIQSLSKQYASNLKASSVYDYPTIRQLARFLEKEVLKQSGIRRIQSQSTLPLDEVIQQVQQGTLDLEKAEQLLNQLSL